MKSNMKLVAIKLIVVAALALLAVSLQAYCLGVAGARLVRRLRADLFDTILSQDMQYFDQEQHNPQTVASLVVVDPVLASTRSSEQLALFLESLVTVIPALSIASFYSWQVTVFMLPFILLAVLRQLYEVKITRYFSEENATSSKAYIAREAFKAHQTIKSLNAEEYFITQYEIAASREQKNERKIVVVLALVLALGKALPLITFAIPLSFAVYLVKQQSLDIFAFFKVFIAMNVFSNGLSRLVSFLQQAKPAEDAVERVLANLALSASAHVVVENEERLSVEELSGKVEFRDVTFVYPRDSFPIILKNVCSIAHEGQITAVIGSTESSINAISDILLRFYTPTEGSIYFGNENICQLDACQLKRQVSFVSKTPYIIKGTIHENITYGRIGLEVNANDVHEVARVVELDDTIRALPEGYATVIDESSSQLSEVQKQRLSLARALLRHPAVLVLHESTGDSRQADTFLKDTWPNTPGWPTTFVFSSNAATLRSVDAVMMLKNGEVTALKNPAELCKTDSGFQLYLSLCETTEEIS